MSDRFGMSLDIRAPDSPALWALLDELDRWADAELQKYRGRLSQPVYSASTDADLKLLRDDLTSLREEIEVRRLAVTSVFWADQKGWFRAGWFWLIFEASFGDDGRRSVTVSVEAPSRLDALTTKTSLESELDRIAQQERFQGVEWQPSDVKVSTTDDGRGRARSGGRSLRRRRGLWALIIGIGGPVVLAILGEVTGGVVSKWLGL